MLWISEVRMVDTVDDLESSRSAQGHHFPNFECWMRRLRQPRTRSSRIPTSKKKVSLSRELKCKIASFEDDK